MLGGAVEGGAILVAEKKDDIGMELGDVRQRRAWRGVAHGRYGEECQQQSEENKMFTLDFHLKKMQKLAASGEVQKCIQPYIQPLYLSNVSAYSSGKK